MNPLRFRARRREGEKVAARAAFAEQRDLLRQHLLGTLELVDAAERELQGELDANALRISAVAKQTTRAEFAEWVSPAWATWQPDTTTTLDGLRVGALATAHGVDLGLPVLFPIHARSTPLVLVSRTTEEAAEATELLGAFVVRLSAAAPKQLRLALLDPDGHGAAFPMSRRLDRVLLGFDDVTWVLDELIADVDRISTTYLDRRHPTFDDLPPSLRLGETHQAMLVSSFPRGFGPHERQRVLDLATAGPISGLQVFVHVDLRAGDAAEEVLDQLATSGATIVDVGPAPLTVHGISGVLVPDELPSGAQQDLIFQRIAAAPRRDAAFDWNLLPRDDSWTARTDVRMTAAIGRFGVSEPYELWFGDDPETGRVSGHGIVVGAAATGRQFVFDGVLAGLASRYAPDQVRFFLVEGSNHPAFSPWRSAPHTEVAVLAPSAQQARQALRELRSICERRHDAVRRSESGTFAGMKAAATSATAMPRLLAIIDGYEQLFGTDQDPATDHDLRTVVEIGAGVGVHLLLGGRRFDATAPLHRAEVFDQLDLRLALQLFPDDTFGRDEFGRQGGRLVQRVCDRPFRAVANATKGHDDANVAVQIAALDPARRDRLIVELGARARARDDRPARPGHVVNGAEQPQLIDNPHVQHLLELPRTNEAVAEFVRRSPANGGLGIEEWTDSEHPLLMFVGQEDSVYGQACFVLRRQATENVLVMMADRAVRTGTVAALLTSVALAPGENTELWVIDRGPVDNPAAETIDQLVRRLGALDLPCRFTREAEEGEEMIRSLAGEAARRRALREGELAEVPTSLLVIHHPERLSALHRIPTEHGTTDSELGMRLRYLLMQGPAVGVHVVLAAPALTALSTVVAETVVHHDLRHRLVGKVAEEDSFVLVRAGLAAELETGGDRAATAALFDSHSQAIRTFRPYSTVGSETGRAGSLSVQLGDLFDRLDAGVRA